MKRFLVLFFVCIIAFSVTAACFAEALGGPWQASASLPVALSGLKGATADGGCIYTFGGMTGVFVVTEQKDRCEWYNPQNDTATPAPSRAPAASLTPVQTATPVSSASPAVPEFSLATATVALAGAGCVIVFALKKKTFA